MSISRSCETIYIGVVVWGIDENEVIGLEIIIVNLYKYYIYCYMIKTDFVTII